MLASQLSFFKPNNEGKRGRAKSKRVRPGEKEDEEAKTVRKGVSGQ